MRQPSACAVVWGWGGWQQLCALLIGAKMLRRGSAPLLRALCCAEVWGHSLWWELLKGWSRDLF